MARQTSFSDIEAASRRKRTKREEFLDRMDSAIPWDRLVDIIRPYYYPGRRGRPPVGIERMLRMYFLQLWFHLSDEGVEEAVYDSRAFSSFLGVGFGEGDQVPDATTLLKFRRIIEGNGLSDEILSCVNAMLEEEGVMMRGGSIVDATIIAAPSSTKNAEGARDPEMHSTRKGNQYYFGMKAHVGADAGSGLVHTVVATAANVHDVTQAHALIREDDAFCYADAGYAGARKRPEVASDRHLSSIDWRVGARPGKVRSMDPDGVERGIESRKASVRCKVEHPFQIVKRRFGWTKCRYRGIRKNESALKVLFALANVAMCVSAGRLGAPAMPA